MQFSIKRDALLKSLTLVQGVIEKKNTLPILSNVLIDAKDNKLIVVATDLDLIFYDEINEVKISEQGSTTTSATILYDILRKIHTNSDISYDLEESFLQMIHSFKKTLLLKEYHSLLKKYIFSIFKSDDLHHLTDKLYITYWDMKKRKQIVVHKYKNRKQ